MALTSRPHGDRILPCGHGLDELWGVVGEARAGGALEDHTRTCPHCTTALEGLHALFAATRSMNDEPMEPTSSLLDRIMTSVRIELRRGHRLALPAGTWGPIEVYEQAVAQVLRLAGDTMSAGAAIVRRCRLLELEDDPPRVRIDLSVVVRAGIDIPALATSLRGHVRTVAEAQVGLRVKAVDIEVEDLIDEGGDR